MCCSQRVWCCLAAMSCLVGITRLASAAEPAPPLVTVETARTRLGKSATIELTVSTAKFAERRKLHFLSAVANFRSKANLPVAIRAADLARVLPDGQTDLAALYEGRRLRVRGIVIEDEAQLMLLVSERGQIEVLGNPEPRAAALNEMVIVSATGERTVLALPLPAELARTQVKLEHDGQAESYDGVLLATVLAHAKTKLGAELRGELLIHYVLVSAADGYTVLLSLPEVDPTFTDPIVLLAERRNGQPLAAESAPLQLVVSGDKRRRRWVSQVARIEVHSAAAPAKAASQPAQSESK